MTDLESHIFLIAYITSNLVALLMLGASLKYPRIARLMFAILFAWASWANWNAALKTPSFYLDYSHTALLGVYREFINGWFSRHITMSVSLIATCQALIAISMLLKATIYKVGIIGGIIFLVCILPLGFYAAFPCTLTMAIAMIFLFKYSQNYIWATAPKQQNNLVAVD